MTELTELIKQLDFELDYYFFLAYGKPGQDINFKGRAKEFRKNQKRIRALWDEMRIKINKPTRWQRLKEWVWI